MFSLPSPRIINVPASKNSNLNSFSLAAVSLSSRVRARQYSGHEHFHIKCLSHTRLPM